jgi:amino acid adenylation domain-containing protein
MSSNNIEDIYPLSPLQQGMLFHSLYAPESRAYFHQYTCELEGPLDLSAFKKAWRRLVDRHTILRTSFEWEELDEPVQIVNQGVEFSIELLNWEVMTSEEQERQFETFMEGDRNLGFELSRAPLMRLSLVRLSDELHRLVWSHHHILLDGWSVPIVLNEVFSFYEAYRQGRELVAEERRPYREYIAWLKKQDMLKAEAFWREKLKGVSRPAQMWVDRGAGGLPSRQEVYGDQHLLMSRAASEKLQGLARQHHLTMNTVLQGAWGLLLSRYSGDSDVIFGVTVSGRPVDLRSAESMIGLFTNTLAQRIQIDPYNSTLDWLTTLQSQQIELQQYSYSPLTEVHKWSEVPPGAPLFETVLVFQNFPFELASALTAGDLKIANVIGYERNNLPLTVAAASRQEIAMRMVYDYCRYEHEIIERMLGHLETILEAISETPEARVGDLPLLSRAERQEIIEEWNQTESEYESQRCLHELIEHRVEAGPDAIALIYQEQRVSYGELNRRANQLAHYLKRLGVGPETRVGICLERSPEMIEAVLGALKAGGVYVPLDPSYPLERLAYMLEDAGVMAMVTERGLLEKLPVYSVRIVNLDEERERIAGCRDENPVGGPGAENLAYIIYTSGSTGQPKGVQVAHRGLCNVAGAQAKAYGLGPEDRVFQFASLSFDAAAFEITLGMTAGASLCLASLELLKPGQDLMSLMEEERITTALLPPSTLSGIAARELPTLKTLIVAGEACSSALVKRWGTTRRFTNAYGPTEATIWATLEECREWREKPAIGRPIGNTKVYILDEQRTPAPIGVAGELFIAGVGLARGYMNRADLTAERFIPNPFNGVAGERMYVTGDLCKRSLDGRIDFIGRKDNQIKLRGFRIELEEIGVVLSGHPAVEQAAVALRENERGANQLVAYLVARTGSSATINELRNYLESKLPHYMVPAAFVVIEAMPLLPNGKVNTKALPELDAIRSAPLEEYVAPANPREEALARIWSEVLGVEQVGVNDNYFVLGGDSIRGIQLIVKAQEHGFKFSLHEIFQNQTIRALAQATESYEVSSVAGDPSRPFQLISEEDKLRLPGDIVDAYPLTMLQTGMVFHSEYSPGVYHAIISLQLRMRIDLDALQRTLEVMVARHPALRTSFDLTGFSQPLQLVHERAHVILQIEDLTHLAGGEQDRAIAEWIRLESKRPFNWSDYPLMRFQVHRRAGDVIQFTFYGPHALFDGWSDGIFLTELFKQYFSALDGKPDPLEPLPSVTFGDYVALELEALHSQESSRYWSQRLNDLAITTLPFWPSPPGATDQEQPHFLTVPISTELSKDLVRIAESTSVSLKSVMLAAHLRVLCLLTGQTDVTTGLVSHGRPEVEGGERMIGLFLNTLPFRLKLQGGSWVSLIRETFAVEAEAMPFRRYPLARIQRENEGLSLFSTAFNYTNFHVYQSAKIVEGVDVLGFTGFGRTDMALVASCDLDSLSNRLNLTLSCNPAQISGKLLEAIRDYYAMALTLMVADPLARYDTACLLKTSEAHELLVEWNETRKDYPKEECLHGLFEQQAQMRPDAVAVVFGGEQVSNRYLNERANQLAHYLRRLGVGPEAMVGICLDRSVDLVTGLLGILKAGGAYVPLDPVHPLERLEFMLRDTGMNVLVASRDLAGDLRGGNILRIVCLDDEWEGIERESVENPINQATAECLVYTIYTSGSTGAPKGVQIAHGALINVLRSMRQAHRFVKEDVLLAITTLSFDIAGLEIFLPLITGARLVVALREAATEAIGLMEAIANYNVTVMQATPAAWQMLVDTGWRGGKQLKLLCGGDTLSRELAVKLRQVSEDIWNLYGPTETTIWSTVKKVESDQITLTIGRPIANTRIYLLDQYQQPVPIGVPGGVYIGGAGVARGYLNQPELTAEKFAPDPFSEQAGLRLYSTGDLARWSAEGELEFLGRGDRQVKIRGHRIEPGEIEAVLNRQPGVRQAVVIMREDEPGQKQLVAYVVGEIEADGKAQWRAALKQSLPDYMALATFVMMQTMPLTPNGKLNHKALPRPRQDGGEGWPTYVAPRTPVEEIIVGVWEWALKQDGIGIHDNFFDLGGHSLSATQVVARLRGALGTELPMRALFENATVAALAEQVAQTWDAARTAPASERRKMARPLITRVSRDGGLPLSFAQQRLWFIDQLDPGNVSYNLPVAVRLRGELDLRILERALGEIIARHEVLRTTFSVNGGKPKQLISPIYKAALEIENLLDLPGTELEAVVRRAVIKELERPFDLNRGPLIRAKVLKLAEQEHVVALTLSHIVADAWSAGVLINEFSALYKAFSKGEPSPLAELEIQYGDYAYWQRQCLSEEQLNEQLKYWKRLLGDELPALKLATERPRPEKAGYRGAHEPIRLPSGLTQKIKELSRREGVTLFMTLLAAFKVLLCRHSGQEDIIVGTAIANRNSIELERLIGLFINILPLRTDLSGDPTFRELLARVREVALGAYAHQDVPFERLVEELQPKRSLDQMPLFRASFVFQNAPRATVHIPELSLEPFLIESSVIKNDLSMSMTEAGDELTGTLGYNADIFDGAAIKKMANHFRTLLEIVAEGPDHPISSLRLLRDEESGNQGPLDFPDIQLSQKDFESILMELDISKA